MLELRGEGLKKSAPKPKRAMRSDSTADGDDFEMIDGTEVAADEEVEDDDDEPTLMVHPECSLV